MANNLRIVYVNQLTAATGGASPQNLLNDYKSQTDTSNTFTLTTNSISGDIAIVAILAENTTPVTMTVNSNSAQETTTSSIATAAPIGQGGGKYVALYFNQATATTTFTVTFNTSVKVSRFIVGNYWSPVYNTSFGVQVGYDDLSTTERLQSGDLYTIVGPRHKTLSFDLEYLTESDKFKLFDIVKLLGKSKPIFISVFPQNTDKEKEQMYSIYGKFQSIPSITYTMFTKYTSSIQVEEI